jgi:hypothetical protein
LKLLLTHIFGIYIINFSHYTVIVSFTDEGVLDTEPNTVSLRREIPIRDYNDNPPVFIGRPYSASISETSAIGSLVEVMPTIIVTDRDEGRNSDIYLSCFSDKKFENDDICDVFLVSTEKVGTIFSKLAKLQL